jgi:hypothetical protein
VAPCSNVPRFSLVASARSSRAFSCDFRFFSSVSGTRMSFWVGTLLLGISNACDRDERYLLEARGKTHDLDAMFVLRR